MPCHSAIVKKNITLSPDTPVEKALKTIRKEKVSAIAVIEDDGMFLGLFSMRILLKDLIPVSVIMSGGVKIDIKVTAAPGVAKRLENVKTLPIADLMEKKPVTVFPDTPIWEGVRMLTTGEGEPLPVVDNTGKFCGLITYDSLINDLENIQSTDS